MDVTARSSAGTTQERYEGGADAPTVGRDRRGQGRTPLHRDRPGRHQGALPPSTEQRELLQLLGDVLELADGDPVVWAVDLNAGGAALWIALLVSHGQQLFYIPGRTVHHASGSYRGDGKTDARDAYVIADQARMRRDL